MKTDLATSILAAVLGVAVAFLACNALLPAIQPVAFKKLNDASGDYSLAEPDVDVFNYRALNPTVEVYVGDCTEYDDYGNCIDEKAQEEEEEEEEEENTDNTNEDENSDENSDETIEPEEEQPDGSTN